MHTLGSLFVTPYRNYFLADGNKILADEILVSPDVIGIISPSCRTASPLVTDCESEAFGLRVRTRRTESVSTSDESRDFNEVFYFWSLYLTKEK